jgi:DNA modification methylase
VEAILKMNEIYNMDCMEGLKHMEENSINCCVTSPPYWNLRDYGVEGQIGLEETLELYIEKMIQVFREVRRVLKNDGTLWLNLGDSYCSTAPGTMGDNIHIAGTKEETRRARKIMRPDTPNGLKPKDLIGLPWRVAFALQADGWYLRSDIIWHKPNPMPESVTDRPTKAHEYIFLFSKSRHYYYDHAAIREPAICPESNTPEDIQRANLRKRKTGPKGNARTFRGGAYCNNKTFNNGEGGKRTVSGNIRRKYGDERDRPSSHLGTSVPWEGTMKNKRDVWTVASQPCKQAHFATYPPKLIEPCILAGCPVGGVVIDPFMGSGTTAMVALELQRNFIGFELNPEYIKIAKNYRLKDIQIRIV